MSAARQASDGPARSQDRGGAVAHPSVWRLGDAALRLDRPLVVGVLNVTPDSFSDGGRHAEPAAAADRAEAMVAEGADLLDLGGESTRPGAMPVDAGEELRRVLPALRLVRARLPHVPISVDTTKVEVAAAALAEGAHAINDVSGLRLEPRIAHICAEAGAGLILMHSRGAAGQMASYAHASYGGGVGAAVRAELAAALRAATDAGVPAERIVLDPGVGFAKRGADSLAVLRALPALLSLGRPMLVGASRKRFIGEITGVTDAAERVHGTVGAHVAALALGARLFRVHDVGAARASLDVAWAVLRAEAGT